MNVAGLWLSSGAPVDGARRPVEEDEQRERVLSKAPGGTATLRPLVPQIGATGLLPPRLSTPFTLSR